jgi:nucleotide-binding universal stress UspA family protein
VINPLRSEEEAFRFTLIVAVLLAPIALAAILFGSGVGLGVAGGLALGLIFTAIMRRRDEPPEKVALRRTTGDDRYRILVVANETLSGAALRREIAHRARARETELRVVCPALNTKLRHWTSDEDDARAQAQQRLEDMLANLRDEGFQSEGNIGESDPVQAMEDEMRQFPADEVIVSTHPPGRSNWLERGVVERARERFPIPVTHVVVDLQREQGLERAT